MAEFGVAELITNKGSSGGSCGTCGGCTVKRRASAEEDNARVRKQMAAQVRSQADLNADADDQSVEGEADDTLDATDSSADSVGGKSKRRRRRRPRQRRTGGDKTVD